MSDLQDAWRIKWTFTGGARPPGCTHEGIWMAPTALSAGQVARDAVARLTQGAMVPWGDPKAYPLTCEVTVHAMDGSVLGQEVARELAVIEQQGQPFRLAPNGPLMQELFADGSVLETEANWTRVRKN